MDGRQQIANVNFSSRSLINRLCQCYIVSLGQKTAILLQGMVYEWCDATDIECMDVHV